MNKIKYSSFEINSYLTDLEVIGSFSSLFSDSQIPFLHYRVTEKIYCNSFDAENLAKSDVAIDAKKRKIGVGIKTFIKSKSNESFQKISEFNKQLSVYKHLEALEKIKKISELRNKRLEFAKTIYDVNNLVYHCIVRSEEKFSLFEEEMNLINIEKIKLLKNNSDNKVDKNNYTFTDGKETYKFISSKSTLYKLFKTNNFFASIEVKILENPLKELRKINKLSKKIWVTEKIILPLYTFLKGKKVVPKKSGLNQWNAGGRERNPDEVYIAFPIDVRKKFENFFPDRKYSFKVELPNGQFLNMKVCQEDSKAIMSNPNKALGKWILREVLKIPKGKLVKYEDLLEIGIDSIVFEKVNDLYKIDFRKIGSYELFLQNFILEDYDDLNEEL